MKAMILAAGHGRRMEPLTRNCAKPALPVLDQSLLARLLESLGRQGIESAVVNAHAHVDSIREAIRQSPIPVVVSVEETLLGSAGGIRAARRHLKGAEPFVVLNGDMVLELDLNALLARHAEAGALATLALRDEPRKRAFPTIGYDERAEVCRITELFSRDAERGDGLFIGVQVLESAIFDRMPERTPLAVMSDLYAPMLEHGERIAAWLQPPEAAWWPIGSPRELLDANLQALDRAHRESAERPRKALVAPGASVEGELVAPVWIGRNARVEAGAAVGPRAVVGAGAVVPAASSWSEALILPGAHPHPARDASRVIAYDEEIWRDG